MPKQKIHIILALFLLCMGVFSFVSAQNFTARVASGAVSLGQEFQVDYTLNANGSKFTPPAFSGFNVSGPSQSTSVNIINGSYSQSITYSYYLSATSEGIFTIGPATIVCNGKTLASNSLTIKVVKSAPSSSQQPASSAAQQGNNAAPAEISGGNNNLFIRILPSKTKVYEGEEITVTIKIYFTRFNVESVQVQDAPDFNGFYSQDVPQNNRSQLSPAKEMINGVPYTVAVIRQNVIFPEHTGKIKINPLSAECIVDEPVRTNNIFDQFFGGSYKRVPYMVKSDPVVVNVLPLPKTEKNFSGAVGQISLTGGLDRNKVQANDAVNLTITISGNGNLALIDTLPIRFPPDFDHYAPKITDHFTINASGTSGSRTFSYLVIPRQPGNFKIPPAEFTYFNPQQKGYVTFSTPEMDLDVSKGAAGTSAITLMSPANKEEVKLLGSDIRYIHTGHDTFYRTDNFFLYSISFYAGIFMPFLVFIGFVVVRRRYVESHRDMVALKKRRATGMARRRLKIAYKSIASANKELFYAELSNALNGYFSDKFSIPTANLSRETISVNLTQKNVKPETLQMVNKTLDDCEFARYAPATLTANLGEVYASAVKLITLLEDEIS